LPIDHARARNPQDLLLCDNSGPRAPSSDRTVARTPRFAPSRPKNWASGRS